MAVPHAQPGEIIDIGPLGPRLAEAKTTTLIKTSALEIIRLVLPAGKQIPTHRVDGEITVQCLEGRVALQAGERRHELGAGQLVALAGGTPHALQGLTAASVIVTILFPK